MARFRRVLRSAALLALPVLFVGPSLGTTLPPGFVETQFLAINAPGSLAWAPDGSLWISQHTGAVSNLAFVWVWRDGSLGQAVTLPVDQNVERGIHTVAVDPDYATNGRIWIYYTTSGPPIRNRVSRFTNVGDVLTGEEVIYDGPASASAFHNGGCLAFDADGTLYVGTGDDSLGSTTAQDPFDPRGKLLHLRPDGMPAADNPFLDGAAGDPRVWALGLRNPFRCVWQPDPGNLFITDVGSWVYEEVNLGIPGANYGWATTEGIHPSGVPGLVYPIYWYPSRLQPGNVGAAIIGGDFVEPGEFDPLYEGDFFFADWNRDEIWRMQLDDDNEPVLVERFASGAVKPSDLEFGPDGALYYNVRQGTMGIRRIEHVGGVNRQPVAVADATPDSGDADLSTVLDGTASFDPDDDTLSHAWDLGDGTQAAGATVMHTYAQGFYDASLTVDDGNGLSATSPPVRIVSGNNRPVASVTAPTDGASFVAGEEITFSATGTDAEEGALPCSRFGWQVLFHHNDHTHPFLGPLQGICSGSFVTATEGETAPDVWYEVRGTVEDTGMPLGPGAELSGTASVEIFPLLSTVTLASTPLPDLTLTLDTTPATAPITVQSVVNLTRHIGAVDAQPRGAHTYRWLSWSDGGAIDHDIATPPSDATFTATFGCDVIVEVADLSIRRVPSGQLKLEWQAVDDPCLTPDPGRYRVYAAATARPEAPPGQFGVDPAFRLVTATDATAATVVPQPDDVYFVVVAVGTDLRDGAAGHYEPRP